MQNFERIHQLVKHTRIPSESVITLLKNTLIGTEGTLYQLLDTETKVHQLHNPHFIYLERNNKAIGNITLCGRSIKLNKEEEHAYYIRYFAFDSIFQGSSKKGNAQSNLHSYFKALFSSSNLNPVAPVYEKSVFWAYIDPQNLRSFNMNALFNFQTIGHFRTKAFSRINPKNKDVERLTEADKPQVKELISSFYADFHLFSSIHLFKNDDYFVLRKKGEIIAGIQANPVHWRIKSLPGLSGRLLLKLAPYIPGIRKLINPDNHRFLATEGLFWKPGHERDVQDLFEGVLHLTEHHSLLLWTDEQNTMLDQLQIKWGFLQKIKQDNRINIVGKFNAYSNEEIQSIKSGKKYINGFDMT